jgi:hypothetical protein
MRRYRVIVAAAAMALATACAPPAQETASTEAAAPCPDDGPRLAHTGLCQGRAVNYFDPAKLIVAAAREDCTWIPNDASVGDGSEAILYMAAKCGDQVTRLEVRGGAQSASIGYVSSGLFNPTPDAEYEPVRMFPVSEYPDPKARILDLVRATTEDKAEAEACQVIDAPQDYYPADALVADVPEAFRTAALKKAGAEGDAYAFCGDYGITSESAKFWRISGGFAWFFDFGQDLPDFQPGSLMLMRKQPDGSWAAVE